MDNSKLPIVIIAVVAVLLCCACLGMMTLGALYFGISGINSIDGIIEDTRQAVNLATPTPYAGRPTPGTIPPTPTPLALDTPDVPVGTPVPGDVLAEMAAEIVPTNDVYDLAERLEGKTDISVTLEAPAQPFQVGDRKEFWVSNVDTNENTRITATLQYVTPHSYFWIENGVDYDDADLRNLAETFENSIYSTNREFFGSEWTPGIDGDPRLYILFTRGMGFSVAGYFSSADAVNPEVHEYSNAHEMFLLSADNVELYEEFTYGVLAHEFQHMIHWYQDRNEETWLNEGFSELAAFLNGYDVGGTDFVYTDNTDIQLTDWPADGDTLPHYGSSFLFVAYFLDRFGDDATRSLVSHPENGLTAVDSVLAEINAIDSLSGELITADDVFADWAIATYLNDPDVGDSRYTYYNYPGAPQSSITETIRDCDNVTENGRVHQYGVDLIRLSCSGDYTLSFSGDLGVQLRPESAYSGEYAFWSNRGDESHMVLSREFDLSGVSGEVELTYWTWYDIEVDYDYVYVTASGDGGQTWQILRTPGGTDADPTGNSYGWGYTGPSDGWVQESVDLSPYAGRTVEVRFEYVTDAAVNGEGMVIDDIAVPQIGYFSDLEDGDDGWNAEGWVRVRNLLPQTFRLSLIFEGNQTTVQLIDLPATNQVEIPLSIGGDVNAVTVVISGTTRFTRQQANYTLELSNRR